MIESLPAYQWRAHMSKDLILTNITKKFGQIVAVCDMNLSVKEGEFVCFLGPSGCGKTTTLRIIAGFEISSIASDARADAEG